MKQIWSSKPINAWNSYLLQASKEKGWIEKSRPISSVIPLSQRELFALIILAHMQNGIHGTDSWRVGFDPNDPEPNDGLISAGKSKINIEHKLVPQMTREETLKAILGTYEKYAQRGEAYGKGRTLVIFGNKQTKGLVKISSLRDQIDKKSPFECVLLMHVVAMKENNTTAVIHITEHYPGSGLAQVDFNLLSGYAEVPHSTLSI